MGGNTDEAFSQSCDVLLKEPHSQGRKTNTWSSQQFQEGHTTTPTGRRVSDVVNLPLSGSLISLKKEALERIRVDLH